MLPEDNTGWVGVRRGDVVMVGRGDVEVGTIMDVDDSGGMRRVGFRKTGSTVDCDGSAS